MVRRQFLLTSAAATAVTAARATSTATILYQDRAITVARVRAEGNELWVRGADLPAMNGFTLKPQGACREDICIPVPKSMRQGEWFQLTGFARKTSQAVVHEAGVWSFGEIPNLRGSFLSSRIAPDFAVPDRKARVVHLSDFRGKKGLVVTWASW